MILFPALFLARGWELVRPGQFMLPQPWPAVLLTAAAVTAIAGPVFVRTLFAHRVQSNTRVSTEAFFLFQVRLLTVSGITPYLAIIAVACDLPQFHAAAIVLFALYSLYYYFPSAPRINFDRKIFRVAS